MLVHCLHIFMEFWKFAMLSYPRDFYIFWLKEKSLNTSEQQAREKILTEEIDKIYQTTKEAIVKKDTTIRAAILTEQSSSAPQDRSNEDSTLQNVMEEPQERITRSKSKTNVSIVESVTSNSEENQWVWKISLLISIFNL